LDAHFTKVWRTSYKELVNDLENSLSRAGARPDKVYGHELNFLAARCHDDDDYGDDDDDLPYYYLKMGYFVCTHGIEPVDWISCTLWAKECDSNVFGSVGEFALGYACAQFESYVLERQKEDESPSANTTSNKFPGTRRAAALACIYLNQDPKEFGPRYSFSGNTFPREVSDYRGGASKRTTYLVEKTSAETMRRDFISALYFLAENDRSHNLSTALDEFKLFLDNNKRHFHL
jgi:hypothetical protein